jgi:hypothetical protein
MPIDISGLQFFMPVFSFLFVFLIVYSILSVSKIIGESKFIHLVISFIISVVFMSFSSLELYIRTVIPWLVVLLTIVFAVLLVGFFFTRKFEDIVSPALKWIIIGLVLIVFLVSAIYVFNPVFHPELGVTGGDSGESLIQQMGEFFGDSRFGGSLLLVIVAVIVAWVLTKK